MLENCLLANIRLVEQQLTKMAEVQLAPLGLHPTYGYIIAFIGEQQPTRVKTIADELNLSSSTITRMIEKLIKLGYVSKGNSTSTVSLSLTQTGDEALVLIKKCWDEFHKSYEQHLTTEELETLQEILRDLGEAIRER